MLDDTIAPEVPTQPAAPNTSQDPSLYVTNIDPSITEEKLSRIFNEIGSSSVHLIPDISRCDPGHAYVKYLNMADCTRALEQLNGTFINGKPCRIAWNRPKAKFLKLPRANLYIKNLDWKIDDEVLHDKFAPFGNILSQKVERDIYGHSKGFGYVQYDSVESAESAIEAMNGRLLGDKKVYVAHHRSKEERPSQNMKQFTNLYVRGFPSWVTEKDLKSLFSKAGAVTSVRVMRTKKGGSKCHGFVKFEDHANALSAIREIPREKKWGRWLHVAKVQPKWQRVERLRKWYSEDTNVFVNHIPKNIRHDGLRRLFRRFGTITSIKLAQIDRHSKGFGYVCFKSPEEAAKAVKAMNGRLLEGPNRIIPTEPLLVALAKMPEERDNTHVAETGEPMTNDGGVGSN